MNLDFFFEDEEHTIELERPSDYKPPKATDEVASGVISLSEASQKVYACRMWQWYDIYKQWVRNGSEGDMFEQPVLEDSEVELSNHFRQLFKAIRTDLVQNSTVTIDGKVYDADEDSQRRLMAAILSAVDDEETTVWVLHDNTVTYLNRPQLKTILRACTLQMSSIWVPE